MILNHPIIESKGEWLEPEARYSIEYRELFVFGFVILI
jgi:hypothetical protein